MRLVYRLVPSVGHLTFVSSSQCVDRRAHYSVGRIMAGCFPSLPLRLLSAARLSARTLLSALRDCGSGAKVVCCS